MTFATVEAECIETGEMILVEVRMSEFSTNELQAELENRGVSLNEEDENFCAMLTDKHRAGIDISEEAIDYVYSRSNKIRL